MECLRDIVKEQGIVNIITDYKMDFENIDLQLKLDRYSDYPDTFSLLERPTGAFIARNPENINMGMVMRQAELSTIEEVISLGYSHVLDWDCVSHNPNLNKKFLIKHQDKLNWDIISGNDYINFSKLESFIPDGRINWEEVSKRKNLSRKMLEKYADKLNWTMVSDNNRKISVHFMENYKDRVDWTRAWRSPYMTKAFRREVGLFVNF